jgi:hypothetical protein
MVPGFSGCIALNHFSIPGSVQKVERMSLREFRGCVIEAENGNPYFDQTDDVLVKLNDHLDISILWDKVRSENCTRD